MADKVMFYPKGSVITFTSGEYSDFSVRGFVLTIQDCDLPKLAQKMANGKEPYMDQDADPDNFPAWLIANGYAMPVDHSQVHLGDYSRWSDAFGVTLKDE